MPERRAPRNTIYLTAKHHSLWQEIKQPVPGCDTVKVTNPKTKLEVVKHGYIYESVFGRVTKIEKYDTGKKFSTRYFGFKLHLQEAAGKVVIDMPYEGQMLRRFLRVAAAIDWTQPLFISVFKGHNENTGEPSTAFWFKQFNATVKAHYTKDNPRGMPPAVQDGFGKWDYKAQHTWLIARMIEDILPAVDRAATDAAEIPEVEDEDHSGAPTNDWGEPVHSAPAQGGQQQHPQIDDDDVPF